MSVGEMLGHRAGDNPHVWYDPNGWTREAAAMEAALARLDPSHRTEYAAQERRYLQALTSVRREIARIRARRHGIAVTATEPVFGYMAQALGFTMRNPDFQKAVMDGTDPAPQAVARMESDLRGHRVRILFYNNQTSEPITIEVRTLAQQQHIPVVGVSELAPRNRTFQAWQLGQLQAVAHALGV
jgi:zinc/manganese transport system substrate-binding protein